MKPQVNDRRERFRVAPVKEEKPVAKKAAKKKPAARKSDSK